MKRSIIMICVVAMLSVGFSVGAFANNAPVLTSVGERIQNDGWTIAANQTMEIAIKHYFNDPDGDALKLYGSFADPQSTVGWIDFQGQGLADGKFVVTNPPAGGEVTVTARACDTSWAYCEITFQITVVENTPPIANDPNPTLYVVADEDKTISVKDYFSDPDGDDLEFYAGYPLPTDNYSRNWLDFEQGEGNIIIKSSYTPLDGDSTKLTVSAWDKVWAHADAEFNIVVVAPETHTVSSNINGIWESPQGDVFFVGSYGTIMRSVGNSEPEPMDSGTTGVTFKSVCGTSDTDVYAVGNGNYNAARIYHYDGNSWEKLAMPTNISTYADLRKIWVNSSDDFYLKASGYIYHCINGIAARILDSDLYEGYGFADMWIRSSSDIYVVGSKGGHGIMLHFDGTAWEEINMTHNGDPLNSISEVSGDSDGLYLKTSSGAKNKIYFYNENNGQTDYIYRTERSIMHRGFATSSYAGYLSLRGPGMGMSLKPSYTSALGITAIYTGQQNVFLGTSSKEIIILKGMGKPF